MDCLTQARFKCLRVVFYIQVNYENNVVVEGKLLKDSLQCSSVFFFLFNFAFQDKIAKLRFGNFQFCSWVFEYCYRGNTKNKK